METRQNYYKLEQIVGNLHGTLQKAKLQILTLACRRNSKQQLPNVLLPSVQLMPKSQAHHIASTLCLSH
jgi:hypothetical protein